MNKLRSVLLVDDFDADNFMHTMLLEELDCTEHIDVALNGREALNYLQRPDVIRPELILLDINMPVMNGWEFLQEYKKLDESLRADAVMMMVTTSLNPDDQSRAGQCGAIKCFVSKPLSDEDMKLLLAQHFPGRFDF